MKRPVPIRSNGFTLLELIGVMAVLAILAAALIPLAFKKQDQLVFSKEQEVLNEIAEGLRAHILRQKSIPDESTWADVIANELGWHPTQITNNDRKMPRVYLIDPELRIGAPDGTLPYTQAMAGSIEPVHPRLLILSSTRPDLHVPVTSGTASSSNSFQAIWDADEGAVPSGWPTSWSGYGPALQVKRIYLAPLFKRLILNNYDSEGTGMYSIDAIATNPIPSGGLNAFFLEDSVLGMHDTNGVLEARQILSRNSTFLYERNIWRGQIFEGMKLAGRDMELAANLFLDAPWNKKARNGVTQADVKDALKNYMDAYYAWEQAGFPTSPGTPAVYRAVLDAQSAVKSTTADLIFRPAN